MIGERISKFGLYKVQYPVILLDSILEKMNKILSILTSIQLFLLCLGSDINQRVVINDYKS